MVFRLGMASESPSRQITVVDVYDLAATIGKDFERIIDNCGTDSVRDLMPKVISALETLEALASRNERENEEIQTLTKTLERLEYEKKEKREDRIRFEQEMEQIEDNYKQEIQDLWEMVQKLQSENKRLDSSSNDESSNGYAVREDELKVMLQLQSQVDVQRRNLKEVTHQRDEQIKEIELVLQQNEKLVRVNKELARKYKSVQNQGRSLVEEKAELLSQLHVRDHGMQVLQTKLGETEKAKKDLEQSQIVQLVVQGPNTPSSPATRPHFKAEAEESAGLDRDNAPRFTLAELREVLQEKNTLKARVLELEEELASLRPSLTPSPAPEQIDDLPVYGPMPKEPDEKLYPWRFQRKESGIRSFLTSVWNRRAKPSDQMLSPPSTSSNVACSSVDEFDPYLQDPFGEFDSNELGASVRSSKKEVDRHRPSPHVTWSRQENDNSLCFSLSP